MTPDALVRCAFAFNILVLLPVVWSLYAHSDQPMLAAFSGRVANVDGLRLMVAALWTGVALCSAVGLIWPQPFIGLLAFQVVYKAIWLATAALPAWRSGAPEIVPTGIAAVFVFIVAVWPIVLWTWWRAGPAAS